MKFFGALKLGIRYNILHEIICMASNVFLRKAVRLSEFLVISTIGEICLLSSDVSYRRDDSAFFEKRKLSLYDQMNFI